MAIVGSKVNLNHLILTK